MTYVRTKFCNVARHCRGDHGRDQPDLGDQAQAVSSKRLDKISDYARHGYAMTVRCRSCGHSAKLDTRSISDDAVRRNLSRDIGAIERRLRCQKCGRRDVRCGPAFA